MSTQFSFTARFIEVIEINCNKFYDNFKGGNCIFLNKWHIFREFVWISDLNPVSDVYKINHIHNQYHFPFYKAFAG